MQSVAGVAAASRQQAARLLVLCLAVALLAACGDQPTVRYQAADKASSAQPMGWSFDGDPAGSPPPGATVFSGSWAVRAEPGAPSPPNALCQIGAATFPAIALGDTVFGDLVMSTRFKPISGKEDQAAGLIFRIQDTNNYYILRANALEGNVNFYKYAAGRRGGIKNANAEVKSGQWQELRVEVAGNRMRGFLNGRLVVEATDDTYKAGKVGLWTKADSVTCFDDVEVKTP